jgi:hypothetical protein
MLLVAVSLSAQDPMVPSPSPAPTDGNLIEDSGFETDQGKWLNYNFGPQFTVEWGATDQRHGGAKSLKLSATQKTDDLKKWEMSGAKLIFPVKPGDIISGGAWLKWEGIVGAEAYIECKWLDANQRELKTSSTDVVGIGTEHKLAGTGDWQYQDLGMWTDQERTAPNEAAFVDFRLTLLAPGTADKATGTVWWDDAKFIIKHK